MAAISRAISEANAGAAIPAPGGELDATIGFSQKVANNIATALSAIDVRVLDIINVKARTSAAERGEPMSKASS